MEALPTQPIQGGHLAKGGARAMFACAIVFPIVATLAVVARFVSHRMERRRYGWDDALIVGALASHIAQMAGIIAGIFVGRFGWETGDGVTARELAIDSEVVTVLQYPYACAMALVRATICVWFLRIFIQRSFKISVYIILALDAAWFVYVIVVTSAQCIPFAANWNKTIPNGHCINTVTTLLVNAVWGVILDIMIWSLPIPRVWNLQLRLALKIALTGVFSLGILDIVVSIMRVITVTQINAAEFGSSVVPAAIWAGAEPAIAILVACLPTCRPLLRLVTPKKWGSTFAKGRSGRREKATYGMMDDGGVELVNRRTPESQMLHSVAELENPRDRAYYRKDDFDVSHSGQSHEPEPEFHAVSKDDMT